MYRRPRFLEILIKVREDMAREADFDVDLFVENLRNGRMPAGKRKYSMTKDPAPGVEQDSKLKKGSGS